MVSLLLSGGIIINAVAPTELVLFVSLQIASEKEQNQSFSERVCLLLCLFFSSAGFCVCQFGRHSGQAMRAAEIRYQNEQLVPTGERDPVVSLENKKHPPTSDIMSRRQARGQSGLQIGLWHKANNCHCRSRK